MRNGNTELELIRIALKEDIGNGDITTAALRLKGRAGKAEVIAKADGVISGIDKFRTVFEMLSRQIKCRNSRKNGERIFAGDRVIQILGPLDALLTGERTAMNILAHLSGVATMTSKFADLVSEFPVRLLDTRKTMPGMREWEKSAVKHGGGINHRRGLYDMYLIKENHIASAGGILAALGSIRKHALKTRAKIEIEVRSISELKLVLPYRPDYVLLDNFSLADTRKAVEITKTERKKTLLEASGNISLKNIRKVAATGVDRISIGALTHSAPALDLSFRIRD